MEEVHNTAWNEYANVLFRAFLFLATRIRGRELTSTLQSTSPLGQDSVKRPLLAYSRGKRRADPAPSCSGYVTQHDDVRELAEAADQVVTFLSNLYQVFPEFVGMDVSLKSCGFRIVAS